MAGYDYDIIIPARYESARLPGKPLADILGKTMIRRVVERAQNSRAHRVIVATDDERIAREVSDTTTAQICETSASHLNGTDRIAEVVETLQLADDRVIVNVQGDEPLISASLIEGVADSLILSKIASMSTAARKFQSMHEWRDSTKVKCIVNSAGHAIYFSRAAVPWQASDVADSASLHHIGIYAYTAGYLKMHSSRPPCELERCEQLEQLRVLFYGDSIAVRIDNEYSGFGVDTEDDLRRVRQILASQSN